MEKCNVKFYDFKLNNFQEYVVSPEYRFYEYNGYLNLEYDEKACCKKETHPSLLRDAITLALSEYLVSPYCSNEIHEVIWRTSILFSYFTDEQYKNDRVIGLDMDTMGDIKDWYLKLSSNSTQNFRTQWNLAFNEYNATCYTESLEQNYIHLITVLEALFVKGNDKIRAKVVGNTSKVCGNTEDERKRIRKVINCAYDIRSSAVHGNLDELIKNLKKKGSFSNYYEFRKIVAQALWETFGKDKNQLIEDIKIGKF